MILKEHEINIPKYNIRGFLDIIEIEDKNITITDIKSMKSYTWKKKFGREYNRDKNPSFMYELQLATYGLGIREEYPEYNIALQLMYYNKDSSSIKTEPIDYEYWVMRAEEYWEEANDYLHEHTEDKPEPGFEMNVPVMDWECNYCSYSSYCSSLYKNERRKEKTYTEPIIKKYLHYLHRINETNIKDRYKDKEHLLHASNAGRCFGIHWYQTHKYKPMLPGDESMLVLRLGTLIHEDIQKSLQ